MTTPGPGRRQRKAARLPEFPPDNELPAALDVGPFIWRSVDAGITVTGFLAYSTGVVFRLMTLSKGADLRDEDPLQGFALEREVYGLSSERPPGALRFGARDVPMTPRGTSRSQNRLEAAAWAPFPPDGDLVFHLEWPAEGIEYHLGGQINIAAGAAQPTLISWPDRGRSVSSGGLTARHGHS